jgi:hypothetical protein
MGTKQEQRKIAFQPKWYEEIKAYSEYSGVPMARLLTRLWEQSKERKEFLGSGENDTEIVKCVERS